MLWIYFVLPLFFFSCYPKFYSLVAVLQATAEQIRLAQMIYDKNDADFEDKVNQVRNTQGICQTIQARPSCHVVP